MELKDFAYIVNSELSKIPRKFIAIFIFMLVVPFAYSNGGCIKIVDDVIVQLSEAPLISKVNKQSSYLFSFVHNDSLINEKVSGTLKIMKGDETLLTKNFGIKDGILDLKHTFEKSGNYELYLQFTYKGKNYNPEDFNVEVVDLKNDLVMNLAYLIIGIIIGAILMKLITKHNKHKMSKIFH